MNFMIYIIILIQFNWSAVTMRMEEDTNKNTNTTIKSRVKRVLPFPKASTVGVSI